MSSSQDGSWTPWGISPDGTVTQSKDPAPTFATGDWQSVEDYVGVRLPADYKDLIGDGDPLCLDDELYVMSPFCRPSFCNLITHIGYGAWAAAYIRQTGLWELDYPIYPEAGGLLPWGSDQNGGTYYWDARADDPDEWTIVVDGRGVDIGPLHYGLKAYLDGLIDRTIQSGSYEPGDWPTEGRLRRVAVPDN